jgi:hypothetical protein
MTLVLSGLPWGLGLTDKSRLKLRDINTGAQFKSHRGTSALAAPVALS